MFPEKTSLATVPVTVLSASRVVGIEVFVPKTVEVLVELFVSLITRYTVAAVYVYCGRHDMTFTAFSHWQPPQVTPGSKGKGVTVDIPVPEPVPVVVTAAGEVTENDPSDQC